MPEFNLDAYLANRLSNDSIKGKAQDIAAASQNKIAALQQKQQALDAQRAADQAAYEQSWVGKLGLEPTGFAANRVNDVASFVSGGSRVLGHIASIPASAAAVMQNSAVNPEEFDAYNRYVTGKPAVGDMAVLNTPNMSGETPLTRIQRANDNRAVARNINQTFDLTKNVEQTNRQALQEALKDGFTDPWKQVNEGWDGLTNQGSIAGAGNLAQGLAGLLMNAGSAIVQNPSGVREYVVENIPQLLVGAGGKVGQGAMLASNVGYALDTYQQGMENYAKANGGQLPPADLQSKMAMQAASLALAEQAGDMIGLSAGKVFGKAADPTAKAVRSSFKQSLKNVTKAGATGFASEAATEGYQTWAEGEITGKPASASDIYAGAVIGGASGGVLSGGLRSLAESTGATEEKIAERTQAAVKQDALVNAVDTGDVSTLLDPKSPAYAPEKAVQGLYGFSQKEDTTPEVKQATLEQASKIVSDLEEQRAKVQAKYDLVSPEELASNKKDLAQYQAYLKQVDPTDTEQVAELEAVIQSHRDQIAAIEQDTKSAPRLQSELKRIDEQIKRAQETLSVFHQDLSPKDIDVEAEVAKLKDPDPVVAQASAQRVLNLAMASPESLDRALATQVAKDTTNGLTEPQRAYLRAFSPARIAANALRDLGRVSEEILIGSSENVGIEQYRQRTMTALAANNQAAADKRLEGITSFSLDHENKATVLAEAWNQFKQTGKPVQVRSDGNLGWFIHTGQPLTATELRKSGDLQVDARSKALVENTRQEANAISAAVTELQAAYALKFPDQSTRESSNVTNVPQPVAENSTQVQEQPQAPAQVEASPSEGSSQATGQEGVQPVVARTTDNTGVVESSPVVQETKANEGDGYVVQATEEQPAVAETPAVVTEGAPASAVKTVEAASAEPSKGQLQSTEKTSTPASVATEPVAVTPTEKTAEAPEGALTKPRKQGLTASVDEYAQAVRIANSEDETLSEDLNTKVSKLVQAVRDNEPIEVIKETAPAYEGLTILNSKTAEEELPEGTKLGEVYRTINKAIAFLTQTKASVKKDSDIAKVRPLVAVGNFLSRWNAGDFEATDFFTNETSDVELGTINTFQKLATRWSPLIRENLIKGGLPSLRKGSQPPRQEFLYEDPIQDFFNEDGSIDENVVTAIAYGAFAWLSDAINGPALKDESVILKMHGVENDDVMVSPDGLEALSVMTAYRDSAASAMGKYVMDALGLKGNGKEPTDYVAKLTTAFGLHTLVLLNEVKAIKSESIDGELINTYLPGINVKPAMDAQGNVAMTKGRVTNSGEKLEPRVIYPTYNYVRIIRDKDYKAVGVGKEIKDASVGSFGVLERLFSTESTKFASWTPIKYTQTKAKKSSQNVSRKQRKILEKEQAIPHRIIPEMWDALTVLGDVVFLKAAGWLEYDEARIQIENRKSVLAKNMGLEDQLANTRMLVEDAIQNSPEKINQPFYVTHDAGINYRVFEGTRNLNLQSSKIQRFMFVRPDWNSVIHLGDTAEIENFEISLAQAFGLKIDQQPNEKTLTIFDKEMSADNNRIKKLALMVYAATKNPEEASLTEAQKQEVAEFAAKREKMQSLQALVAYGKFLDAQAQVEEAAAQGLPAPSNTVSVPMLVGVDGKNNGAILSHASLGAAPSADALVTVLNRGGMYTEADGVKNYNEWYQQPSSQDMYEDLAYKFLDRIEPSADLDAIYTISGPLVSNGKITSAGRSIPKTPLLSLVFGSSINSSMRNMKNTFVASVFDRIQAVATGKDTKTRREDLIRSINRLMGGKLPLTMTIEELMDRRFIPSEKEKIAESFDIVLGGRASAVMKDYFKVYLERRNEVNNLVQGSFGIYDAIYQELREKEVQRLMDEGEIAFTVIKKTRTDAGVRTPLHDLTAEQDTALREKVKALLPVANTAFTIGTDELDAGLLMAKTGITKSNAYNNNVKVQLGKRIPTANGWEVSVTSGHAMARIEENPGVRPVSFFTHSLDSGIMLESTEDTQTKNIFDEAGNGVSKVKETARAINRATWNQLLKFSPLTESYEMFGRTLLSTVKFTEGTELSATTIDAIKQQLKAQITKEQRKAIKPGTLVVTALRAANNTQLRGNRIRLETLAKLHHVDQYTWEGGQYDVTDADRANVAVELQKLGENRAVSAELMAAAEALDKLLGGTEAAVETVETETTATNEQDSTETPMDTFGPLGTSNIPSDPGLVSFFKANPNATAAQVIKHLASSGNLSAANRKLLYLASRTIKPGLLIQYVTPYTKETEVLEKPTTSARGWYVAKDGTEAIYVLSPDFVNSGLTEETLLHEIVHAVIAQTIENPSKEAKELVDELGVLLKKAQDFIQGKEELQQYSAALSVNWKEGDPDPLHEFVAWGMTNQGFQKEVLSQIELESQTSKNGLVKGMKKFIDALVGLLGGKRNKVINDGLTTLVTNVSGLFYEAGQSKGTPIANVNQSQANVTAIDRFSTQDILDGLDNVSLSTSFQEHLSDLLGGMVDKLYGPFGAFAAQYRKNESRTPLDAWLKALTTGKAPFASSILANMAASNQEAFAIEQVEATVKAALEGNEAPAKEAYRALYNLYGEVRKGLKADGSDFFKGDWNQATPSEKSWAKQQYDFVLKVEANQGDRSDYLARFAALGLAHEGFNSLLKKPTNVPLPKTNASWADRLQDIFEKILGFFRDKVTHTYAGQPADEKLERLVNQLVEIEAKQRMLLKAQADKRSVLAPTEAMASKAVEGTRKKIAAFADSPFMRNRKNGFVQGARSLVSTVANERVQFFMQGSQKFYEEHVKASGSVVVSLLKEVQGHRPDLLALLRETKKFEGDRKDKITQLAKQAQEAFGEKLDKDNSAAVTSVFMRTGLHNLLDRYSLAELETLVGNKQEQDKAIAEYEGKLNHMKNEYLHQIKGLAYYRATEETKIKTLMMNAHLIARLAGTSKANQISEAQATAAEDTIKSLVSLYALKYTSTVEQAKAKEIFRKENNRGAAIGNGVEFVLKAHKQLEKESLAREFKGNPALMMHGFTPEITNPYTEFQVVGEEQGQALLDLGYAKGGKVMKDPGDPSTETKHIYVRKGVGLTPRVSGAILFQSMKAKGTRAHDGWLKTTTQQGINNAQVQAQFDNSRVNDLANVDPAWDPSTSERTYAAPVYNEQGKIVNWRYLMYKGTKDALLERNNSFDRLLGVHAGSTFSKETTREQTKKVLESLLKVFKEEYALHQEAYVTISATSPDPALREIWGLLSEETRQDVRSVWKTNEIRVKADALDLIFGYRKRSIGEVFDKAQRGKEDRQARGFVTEANELNVAEHSLVWASEMVLTTYARVRLGMGQDEAQRYAKRAGTYLVRGERGWQELMKEVKNIYVIKTISTLAGNIFSNVSQLLLAGVSPKDIAHHHVIAMKAASAYATDSEDLATLENQLAMGYTLGKEKEIEVEITRLKDAIARNPVKELIDAGLMPTIVDDGASDEDPYAYKTALVVKAQQYTDKLNTGVVSAAKLLYMNKETQIYKALFRTTQLSDFVARYTLYQHLISRKDKPLSKQEAINDVSEAFVNYDLPMHRDLQYTDDLGLTMFTKYFLRMQRVLLKMERENPIKSLALLATDSYLNLGPIVLESSFISHLGNNPLSTGVLQFPSALGELATVKAGMALIK